VFVGVCVREREKERERGREREGEQQRERERERESDRERERERECVCVCVSVSVCSNITSTLPREVLDKHMIHELIPEKKTLSITGSDPLPREGLEEQTIQIEVTLKRLDPAEFVGEQAEMGRFRRLGCARGSSNLRV